MLCTSLALLPAGAKPARSPGEVAPDLERNVPGATQHGKRVSEVKSSSAVVLIYEIAQKNG